MSDSQTVYVSSTRYQAITTNASASYGEGAATATLAVSAETTLDIGVSVSTKGIVGADISLGPMAMAFGMETEAVKIGKTINLTGAALKGVLHLANKTRAAGSELISRLTSSDTTAADTSSSGTTVDSSAVDNSTGAVTSSV